MRVLLPLLLLACARPPQPAAWIDETRPLWAGISVRVAFAPADAALAARVWAGLESIGGVADRFRPDSELSRANAAVGDVRLSPRLRGFVALSLEVSAASDGAFDISVTPLLGLWRAAVQAGAPPAAAEIDAALARVGWRKLSLDGETLRRAAPGMTLDLGGVVKGAAVDEAVAALTAAGVSDFLVQAGGETQARGRSQRGRPHVIGVEHPTRPGALYTGVVDPGGGLTVSTSGNSKQPLVIAGRPFYHIVDPRTGQPVSTRILSTTVVFAATGRGGVADALATAVTVLGPDAGLPLVERLGGEALVLVAEGEEIRARRSQGFSRLEVPSGS